MFCTLHWGNFSVGTVSSLLSTHFSVLEKSKFCCNSIALPNNKILLCSKLKALADNKIDVVKMMISLLERVENTVGKGENAGYQHFLLFPQCFPSLPP